MKKMTTQLLELEGTWEEILAQSAKFADRRVRVIVLADEEPLKSAEDCFRQGWHEAMTGGLYRFLNCGKALMRRSR